MSAIYLDNQSTTPTKEAVLEEMKPFWNEKFGNPHSSEHITGLIANQQIEIAKSNIANSANCEVDVIFFTSGATEANNHAMFALSALGQQNARKQVIISPIEHKCIIEAASYWASVFKLDLQYVAVDRYGFIDIDHLKELLEIPTLFCSIIGVNNEIGTIQDLTTLGKVVQSSGSVFHSDLSQAPKAMALHGVLDYLDLASFSGHKIGGPPGIGCLYITAQLHSQIQPLMHGGGQQQGIRSGTLPLPLCVGLGSAFSHLNLDDTEKMRLLRDHLFDGLKGNIPDISINGPELSKRHAGNLNIRFPGIQAADLLASLQPKIAASTGSACSSGSIEPSYVIKAISGDDRTAEESIRLGVNEIQTFEEIEIAVKIISKKYLNLLNK